MIDDEHQVERKGQVTTSTIKQEAHEYQRLGVYSEGLTNPLQNR